MESYVWLIVVAGLGVLGLVVIYLYQRHRSEAGTKHTWLSYVLLWPLVLDADKDKREGRFFTTREWIGWGVVLLLIALAIAFTPSRRTG
jgi:hypothetical protein